MEDAEPRDERGRRRVRCIRPFCKRRTRLKTPHEQKDIHLPCRGLPLTHEVGHWIEFFASVLKVNRALAIAAFLHWRAKGSPLDELPPGVPNPGRLPSPAKGPGTELHKLLESLGVTPQSGCKCREWTDRMNVWQVEGCRAHRDEILAHLREAYDESSIATKAAAFGNALANGLPLTLAGLLDLAIERAAERAAERA